VKLVLTMAQGPDRGRKREVDAASLVVGRGEDCGWVVADPERMLSKNHLRIDFREGQYILTDTSTNGVFINGAEEPLGRGNQAMLKQGDRIVLGRVTLSVDLVAPTAAEDPFFATLSKPPAAAPLPIEDDPFAPMPSAPAPSSSLGSGGAIPDDFDLDLPLLSGDPLAGQADSPFAPAPQAGFPSSGAGGIPDDWLGPPVSGSAEQQAAAELAEALWRLARVAAAAHPDSPVAGNAISQAGSATAVSTLLSGPSGEQTLRRLFSDLQELVLRQR